MPATKRPAAKAPARTRPQRPTDSRVEHTDRAVRRIVKSLDAAQKDLAAIGASLGTGAAGLRKDVARMLRDARRDVEKMGHAVRRDLEQLQKDVAKATPRGSQRTRPASSRTKATGRNPADGKPALISVLGAILRQRRSRKLRREPGCRLSIRASTAG